jgi:hypothetical protein
MKISIWQQFSSNHSSHFIVIGRFQTVSDAQAKAAELRDWMHRMLWGNNESGKNKRAAEAEIIAKYGVSWYEDGIDWNGYPEDLDETVRQVRNDVLMICPVETWDSHEPFIELIEKMGAHHIVQHESDWYSQGIIVDLRCIAPNADVAREVYVPMKRLLDENSKDDSVQNEVPFPWATFSPNFQKYATSANLSIEDYLKAETQWIHDVQAWTDLYRANRIASEETRLTQIDLWKKRDQLISQDQELIAAVDEIRSEVRIDEGNIRLNDTLIEMEDFNFAYVDIGIIALLGWLEALGCEVSYQFRERDKQ